jgi:signal transduction histidine kinase
MEGTSANLDETFAILSRALQQIRDLSLNLRPSILDDLGLAPALRWFLDRESLADRPKAQLVVDQSLEKRLPPEIELACFRLVQEAITNVLRHARAQQVSVELWQSHSTLHLLIRDDGAGFDAPAMLARAARSGSLGLLGMQERVALVGGQIEILSEPGSGTEIHVRIPISGETP